MNPFDAATDPFLTGIFAPQRSELAATPVTVTSGEIPRDLAGTYYRNGPNARFAPIGSYTFPLDGDGMIHALTFENGRATYRNRFVRTPSVRAEERAGRALWGGLMTPITPSAQDVPEMGGQYKDLPDVNVVRHAGRLLALAEGGRQFELDDTLATVGAFDWSGRLSQGFCAHPKIDPATGEMIVFRYGFAPPLLTWAAIGADGLVTRDETPIEIDATYMIHDCTITRSWLVLFVCPLRFDLTGGPPFVWDPDKGTRIALVPRNGGSVRWITTDAFWVWHFANAYEETRAGATSIVVDFARWDLPPFGAGARTGGGQVVRARLDPAAGTARFDVVNPDMAEFPRIDDRRIGAEHRFVYVAQKHPGAGRGNWDLLRRFDMGNGEVQTFAPGAPIGEPVFAPMHGRRGEDEGYVLTYRHLEDHTELLVLRAAQIDGPPAAVLRMPQRVPVGLHGSFVTAG